MGKKCHQKVIWKSGLNTLNCSVLTLLSNVLVVTIVRMKRKIIDNMKLPFSGWEEKI